MLTAQRLLVGNKHVLSSLLRQLPIFKGRKDIEIVEGLLPFPGLLHEVPLENALIPGTMLAVLLDPSMTSDPSQLLGLLVGPRLAKPIEDHMVQIVDALPPETPAKEVTV
jgi:hypothetical protein